MNKGLKRLTISITDNVHKELSVIAAEHRCTLSEVITKLADKEYSTLIKKLKENETIQ